MPPRKKIVKIVKKATNDDLSFLDDMMNENMKLSGNTSSEASSSKAIDSFNPFSKIKYTTPATFTVPDVSYEDATQTDSSLLQRINYQKDKFNVGITNIPGDVYGRRVVARKNIKAGEIVVVEQPIVWTPEFGMDSVVCNSCANRLHPSTNSKTPLNHGFGLISYPAQQDSTKTGYFCSDVCLEVHQPIVAIESQFASHLQRITDASGFNIDLLRLCIRFLVIKFLQETSTTDLKTVQSLAQSHPTGYVSSTYDVECMVAHHSFVNDDELLAIAKSTMSSLYPLFPLPLKKWLHSRYNTPTSLAAAPKLTSVPDLLAKSVLNLAGKFNANILSLTFENSAATNFGITVSPLVAHFNHSCTPNSVFVNDKRCMVVRAISDIREGEELLINYVSLDEAPRTRGLKLRTEKDFVCCCNRCGMKPENDVHVRSIFADVLLGGIRVNPLSDAEARSLDVLKSLDEIIPNRNNIKAVDKNFSGYKMCFGSKHALYLDSTAAELLAIKETTESKNDDSAQSALIEVSTDFSKPAEYINTGNNTWTEEYIKLQNQKIYIASNDKDKTITGKELDDITLRVNMEYERAQEIYLNDGQYTVTQKIAAVDSAFIECYKYLSPLHEFVVQLAAMACNLANKQQDTAARLKYSQIISAANELILPPNFLTLANTYEGLSDAGKKHAAAIQAKTAIPASLRKTQSTTLLQEAKKNLEKELKTLNVCLGDKHTRYLIAKDQLARF